MGREETERRFRLWLLALALAVALTWYVINPAPGPIRRRNKDDDARDGQRRQVRAGERGMRSALRAAPAASTGAAADDNLLEWPEYLEL